MQCPHRELSLTLTYEPLSLFRFNMYASMTRDNPWASMMGGVNDQSDEDQDTIKVCISCCCPEKQLQPFSVMSFIYN